MTPMIDSAAAQREKIPAMALVLGLAGIVPFAGGAIGTWINPDPVMYGFFITLVLTYGAVILSFLGGVRWGAVVNSVHRTPEIAFSVAPSLAGWISLLMPPVVGVSVLIGGFLLQALWDVTGVHTGRLPDWYGRLRMGLTTMVIISLLAVLGKLVL